MNWLNAWRRFFPRLRTELPLGRRLATMTLMSLTAVVLAVGATAYFATQASLYQRLDGTLVNIGNTLMPTVQQMPTTIGGLTADATTTADVTLLVVRADGVVSGIPGVPTIITPGPQELSAARTQLASEPRTLVTGSGVKFRVTAMPFTAEGQHYALVVARPLDSTEATLRQLWWVLLAVGLVGMVSVGIGGWWVSRQTLAPIRELSRAVAQITETDQLTPIPSASTDDLGNLTESFNTMLNSVSSSRERQKRLIADAGHELRTPLTSMRTNVELLVADENRHMLPDGARAEILHDIAAQLGEFTSLVGDLVQLSREDKATAAPEALDFAEVVRSAIVRARRRGPGLRFDVELDPLYIMGESDTLERAVTNLLDNAVKFSPPGGTIRVHLEGDVLRISDEGPGIAEEDLPHVFDRFFRSDRARSTPGTGLGLSIVAHTLQAHGGWVRAGRAAEGGAEFTLHLPGSSHDPEDLPLDEAPRSRGSA